MSERAHSRRKLPFCDLPTLTLPCHDHRTAPDRVISKVGTQRLQSPRRTALVRHKRSCCGIFGLRTKWNPAQILPAFSTFLAFGSHAVAGTGQLTVSPSSINFGSVAVGSSNTQSVTLSNSGGPKITISQVSLSGTGFTVSGLTTPLPSLGDKVLRVQSRLLHHLRVRTLAACRL
jgi:hypothetical protein